MSGVALGLQSALGSLPKEEMARVISARAWANNEVAYVAWDTDEKIPGCLGTLPHAIVSARSGSRTAKAP